MKTYVTTALLIFTVFIAKSQDLQVELSTSSNNFKISKELCLLVTLTNTSSLPIKIPHGMSVTSNLLPNGLEDNHTAVNIEFEIEGIEKVALFIENLTYQMPTKFTTLNARESIKYSYDLSKHFQEVEALLENEYKGAQLKISAAIMISYLDENARKTLHQKATSNSISILFTK